MKIVYLESSRNRAGNIPRLDGICSNVQNCLTQRAADGGYAPRFLGIFLALGCSRFDGESILPPTAANASR